MFWKLLAHLKTTWKKELSIVIMNNFYNYLMKSKTLNLLNPRSWIFVYKIFLSFYGWFLLKFPLLVVLLPSSEFIKWGTGDKKICDRIMDPLISILETDYENIKYFIFCDIIEKKKEVINQKRITSKSHAYRRWKDLKPNSGDHIRLIGRAHRSKAV